VVTSWSLVTVGDISADGKTIVGQGINPDGNSEEWIANLEVDTDGDGIPDDEDGCPDSDLTDNVVIDGCDSGVENVLLDDGCTISDLIWQCAEDTKNHGQFNSAVSQILNDLKKDGTISGEEKEEIQICAAGADIP
jgi:hypothetical protein